MDGLRVHVKTNEARLLRFGGGIAQGDREDDVSEWTIVCDAAMPPELGDPLVLVGKRTSFLSFGRAGYFAVAHEKKEVTGFVSAGVSDEDWAGVILPAVLGVCRAAPDATKVVGERRG
jgi:hypothetical protein